MDLVNEINTLKKIQTRILEEKQFSFAFVGGCVRDFILDYPIKDVDVVINYPDYDKIENTLKSLFLEYLSFGTYNNLNFKLLKVGKLDLIIIPNGLFHYVANFPVSISKVLIRNNVLYIHKDFIYTLKHKTILMCNPSLLYETKIRDKFHKEFECKKYTDVPQGYNFSIVEASAILNNYISDIDPNRISKVDGGTWFCIDIKKTM